MESSCSIRQNSSPPDAPSGKLSPSHLVPNRHGSCEHNSFLPSHQHAPTRDSNDELIRLDPISAMVACVPFSNISRQRNARAMALTVALFHVPLLGDVGAGRAPVGASWRRGRAGSNTVHFDDKLLTKCTIKRDALLLLVVNSNGRRMGRYKDYRQPKHHRGYDDDYTPPDRGAERRVKQSKAKLTALYRSRLKPPSSGSMPIRASDLSPWSAGSRIPDTYVSWRRRAQQCP